MRPDAIASISLAGIVAWGAHVANAAAETDPRDKVSPIRQKTMPHKAEPFTEGVVRHVDRSGGYIVVRHGPIENLGIPPMTMIFRVNDPRLIESLDPGTEVRFAADRLDGKFTIVHLERR